MTEEHHLGHVARLHADAVGQPGHRRFQLLVDSVAGASAVLWLEKEQLFNLGLALKRLIGLAGGKEEARESADAAEEAGEPVAGPDLNLEFQVQELAVGYDAARALYLIGAESRGEDRETPKKVNLVATEAEVDALADEAFAVCAAGRPLCPLCGASMDTERHVCPRHNGHGPAA
ncbi:MAG: DUF3090 family protein [Chloroflexi bacterium]|nr:DUF3090 family protein [Chloroflexota bacterium]